MSESHCFLLWGRQRQACPTGHVVKELTPTGQSGRGGGYRDDPQVPGKPQAWGSLALVPGPDSEE